jgi:hypothetical protein
VQEQVFFQAICNNKKNNPIFVLPKTRGKLSDGVTGNTSDFGSEESRFEPWSDNNKKPFPADAGGR